MECPRAFVRTLSRSLYLSFLASCLMKPLHNQLFVILPFSLHTHYFRTGDSGIYVVTKHLHHRLKSSFGKLVDKKF
jgi:hypothetical protein